MKFAAKACNIFYHTLSMLLHYPGNLKVQICCKSGEKCSQNALIFTRIHLLQLAYLLITFLLIILVSGFY